MAKSDRVQSLQQIHGTMHASHAPDPDAEAGVGGDQGVPVGSVRVEQGRYRNDDGTVYGGEVDRNTGEVVRPARTAWKVFQLREVAGTEADKFKAKMDVAGFPVGEQIVRVRWEPISQHDTEQEALTAAAQL